MSTSGKEIDFDYHAVIPTDILKDTHGLTKDFYKGYQDYYSLLIQTQQYPWTTYDNEPISSNDKRLYWLTKAIEINSNGAIPDPKDPSASSNTFIRDVSRNGLLYDGKATTSNVDQVVQHNSDLIGRYVLGDLFGFNSGNIKYYSDGITVAYDYTKIGKVRGISDFITNDIRSALDKGGQTVATWGGSFFFWNTPLDGKTVGEQIRESSPLYEEFLAIDAKATYDTALSLSSGSSVFGTISMAFNKLKTEIDTSWEAQAPLSVKADIAGRIVYGAETGNWNGDPNEVDGYTAHLDKDGNFVGWLFPTIDGPIDVGDMPSLDAIRNIRLSAPTDWFGGVPTHARNRALDSTPSGDQGPAPGDGGQPGMLEARAVGENTSLVIALPPGPDGGPGTVVTSGDGAPVALGGTVALVDGQLVYTPGRDVVGRDYVLFETSDGTTTTDWAVPVTISGVAHDTTTAAPDGAVTVEHFGGDGMATTARTDRPDGSYTLSRYAEAAGTSYLAEADDDNGSGTLLARTLFGPDGTILSETTFTTADDGSATTTTTDGQGMPLSSTTVHADGTKDVLTYLRFSNTSRNRMVDTAYDAAGGLVGQTFETAYGWAYASGSAVRNADGSSSETVTDTSGAVLERDTFFADGSRDVVTPATGELWADVGTLYGADGRVAARRLLDADGSTFLAGTASYDMFGAATITYAADADGTSAVQAIAADGSSELTVTGIVGQAYATSDSSYDDAGTPLGRTLGYGDGSVDTQTFDLDWSGQPYLSVARHADPSGLETSKVIYDPFGSVVLDYATARTADGTFTTVTDGDGTLTQTVTVEGAVTRTTTVADGSVFVNVADGGSYETRGDEANVFLGDGDTLRADVPGVAIAAAGSGNVVDVSGTGASFSGSGNALRLAPGASAAVVGNGNDVGVGPGGLALVGIGNVVHFDAAPGPAASTMTAKGATRSSLPQGGDVLDLSGVDPADAAFSHDGTDLLIALTRGGTIDVVDEFGPDRVYDTLTFADGSAWDAARMAAAAGYAPRPGFYDGSSQEDDLSPGLVDTTFDLGRGDDSYYDEVNSGNTFRYASGDGNDVYSIGGTDPGTDSLALTDLSPGDVRLAKRGGDLLVTDLRTGATVTVSGQFDGDASGIASIGFADGTVWDRDRIEANAPIRGTDGDDRFRYANYTDSRIDLGKGNDTYVGYGAQGDTFLYRTGDGNDVYSLSSVAADDNVLKLVGLAPGDVGLLATGHADTDLVLTDRNTGQTVTLSGEFDDMRGDGALDGVSKIAFADGTTWDRSDMAANASDDDQVVSADDATLDVTSNVTVLVTGARDGVDVRARGAAVKVRGTDATVSASYASVDFLAGATGTLVGDGNAVRVRAGAVVALSGSYDAATVGGAGARLSGDGATVTVLDGAAASISGDGDHVTLRNGATIDLSGRGSSVTVTGDGNALTIEGSGNTVYVGGDGDTLTLGGEARVTSDGTGTTFVFTPQTGSSSVRGIDDGDDLRFSVPGIDGWQSLLDRSAQQGADAVIQVDDAHSLTLAGVTLSTLDRSRVAFG